MCLVGTGDSCERGERREIVSDHVGVGFGADFVLFDA